MRLRKALLWGALIQFGLIVSTTGFLGERGIALSAPVPGSDVTYTVDGHFDQGTLLNVNHNAPNSDQLQLNQTTTPFPFVNIAASARGTIVRIDVATGAVLGEYLTAPDGMGRNPSRTTVDQFGNVWVSNRDESGFSGGQNKGSVTRAGLVIGGIRADADGTPNPLGQYLAPPFQYSTCADRDSDGLIKTSRGLGNILPWTNAGGVDTHGGVSTADDECVINYTRVTGTNTRTVAIDANNDVWVGGLGDLDHEKISGVTGLPIPGTQFNLGCGGYGGLVDGNGVLWSAQGGAGLLRFDTTVLAGACLGFGLGDYGLGIDPQTGNIWHTYLSGNAVCEIAPGGALVACYAHGEFYAQGVAVDGVGNAWVAHSLIGPSTTVGHVRTDGTFVGNVPLPGGSGPTGVAVDANGKVWVANINSNNAMRIDPNGGPIGGGGFNVGAVDLTVDLGPGAGPYNYSDMTGFVSIGATSPQGTWTVTQDSGVVGNNWGTITWNVEPEGSEPPETSITVEARAADTEAGLSSQIFATVLNGAAFMLTGEFIEVRATLKAGSSGESPVLSDIRVQVLAVCGNNNVEPGEECDDGNAVDGDCCSSTCQAEDLGTTTCGVGVCQRTVANCVSGAPQVCTPGTPEAEGPFESATCADGVDNDCDGLTDRLDPDCNAPPICGDGLASPTELWPPNHKFAKVSVVGLTDPDGDPVAITVTGITQDEALDALGDGHTCPDGAGVETDTALVRAERGKLRRVRRNGRVYHVSFTASDGRGGECSGTVQVCVPPNQRRGHVCVDEGPLFDSTGPCR